MTMSIDAVTAMLDGVCITLCLWIRWWHRIEIEIENENENVFAEYVQFVSLCFVE